jgi:SAM-dependent methyltransferase
MASWLQLDEAVLTGRPVAERSSFAGEDEIREDFLLGMFDLAMLAAPRIVPLIDLSQRRRLLDLGGGPGTYPIQFCRRNPHLAAVVFDLPATRGFAEATIDRFGLSGRIVFAAGDFTRDEIPGRYDVAWLSHVLHGEGPAGCALILDKVVSAVEPGGMVLIQEFILDDTREGPLHPALFSLNMLLVTPSGQAYTEGELTGMLSTAGVREIHRLPLDLPNDAGVIAGFVP